MTPLQLPVTGFFAVCGQRAVWLGIATMMVSFGNTVAHMAVFNIRGKTFYNASFATSWLLFVPCIYLFFTTIHRDNLVIGTDYAIGLFLVTILK